MAPRRTDDVVDSKSVMQKGGAEDHSRVIHQLPLYNALFYWPRWNGMADRCSVTRRD